MTRKVLIVDDEKDLLGLVSLHMKMAGFEVIQALDGHSALNLCRQDKPNLVILDLMLPEMNGWEVCKILKETESTKMIPIIILSAMSETEDKIKGFDAGADDYVTKPFSPRELVARAKRVLARGETKAEPIKKYSMGDLEIDLENLDFHVRKNNRNVALTQKEKQILKALVQKPGELITHDQLLDAVWTEDNLVEYGNIAVHIRHLREKIEKDPKHPLIIKTIKGLGYRLNLS